MYLATESAAGEQSVATIRQLSRENDRLVRRLNELKTGNALIGCGPAARRLSTVLARAGTPRDADAIIAEADRAGKKCASSPADA